MGVGHPEARAGLGLVTDGGVPGPDAQVGRSQHHREIFSSMDRSVQLSGALPFRVMPPVAGYRLIV